MLLRTTVRSLSSSLSSNAMAQSVYQFSVKDVKHNDTTLAKHANKVLLLVNVASKCGYTKQYAGLEAIYEELKSKGFEVIGFPCNQFGGQEPGTNEEIVDFCERTFGVKFPLMDKIDVNGPNASPLFTFLKQSTDSGDIKWNFTKFLVDKSGKVVKRYETNVKPESIKADILAKL